MPRRLCKPSESVMPQCKCSRISLSIFTLNSLLTLTTRIILFILKVKKGIRAGECQIYALRRRKIGGSSTVESLKMANKLFHPLLRPPYFI